jgi:hypothetical protein
MQPLFAKDCLVIRILNQKPTLKSDMQHIDELFASRLKGYSQTPPDHLWLLIESKLDLEDNEELNNSLLKKLLTKFRITHS